MKKYIYAFNTIFLILSISLLVGCGGSGGNSSSNPVGPSNNFASR